MPWLALWTGHSLRPCPDSPAAGSACREEELEQLLLGQALAQALQRRVFELLRDDFDVYFSTVQLETECLEREEAREIDAAWAASASSPPRVTVPRSPGPSPPSPNGKAANGRLDPRR